MALALADRLLTVVVTATLTSAAWIVVGSGYVERDEEPAPAATSMPRASESSAPAAAGPLLIPVEGVAASQLSDTFDDERGGGRPHEALDIMAPAGTPVLAAAAGTVEKLFKSDDGGNTVYIRSPDRRTLYYYAHLQAYAPDLTDDSRVARGQRLGSVGATGNADPAAPHLHFAMMRMARDGKWWEPGTAINPYPLLAVKRQATGR